MVTEVVVDLGGLDAAVLELGVPDLLHVDVEVFVHADLFDAKHQITFCVAGDVEVVDASWGFKSTHFFVFLAVLVRNIFEEEGVGFDLTGTVEFHTTLDFLVLWFIQISGNPQKFFINRIFWIGFRKHFLNLSMIRLHNSLSSTA